MGGVTHNLPLPAHAAGYRSENSHVADDLRHRRKSDEIHFCATCEWRTVSRAGRTHNNNYVETELRREKIKNKNKKYQPQ